MSLRRLVPFVLVALALFARPADAHPLGNFTINHLVHVRADAKMLSVRYVGDFAEIPAYAILREIAPSAAPTSAQLDTWARAEATTIAGDLHVAADGKTLALTMRTARATTKPGAGGLRTIRLVATYAGDAPGQAAHVVLRDATYPNRLGWKDTVLAPATEPTSELTVYPNALLGSPRQTTTLAFTIDAHDVALRTDAPAPVEQGANASPGLARSNALSDVLAHGDGSWTFFFGALLLAVGLGALHALEPGHGKTLLAVSLVGARATMQQAAILAGALTVAHTAGVLALGVVVLYAARWIVPEQIYPWITLGSGAVVAYLGAQALARYVRARRPLAHEHVHGHRDAQPHVHEHEHGLAIGDHDHQHGEETDAAFAARIFARHRDAHNANLTHAHDGTPHSHEGLDDEAHALAHRIPGTAPLKFRTAVLAAMSGGIAPCPAALVVLLAAIQLKQIALGLILIVAFSFGLAAVLTGLGIAVVRSAAWLGKQKRFDLVTRYAPLVSASVIAIIGSALIGQGLADQGVPLPVLAIAAISLLAIAGYAFAPTHTHRSVTA